MKIKETNPSEDVMQAFLGTDADDYTQVDCEQFGLQIGQTIVTNLGNLNDVIAIMHGVVYDSYCKSYRVVLTEGISFALAYITIANELQDFTFLRCTKDFQPVQKRMTVFFK